MERKLRNRPGSPWSPDSPLIQSLPQISVESDPNPETQEIRKTYITSLMYAMRSGVQILLLVPQNPMSNDKNFTQQWNDESFKYCLRLDITPTPVI